MKRFTIPCDFNGVKHPFHVYIGEPRDDKHPLQNQAWWLSNERGGTIPQDVMDSFEKLHKISKENNVSFEDLCVYALGSAQEGQEGNQEGGNATAATESAPPADNDTPPQEMTAPEAPAQEEAAPQEQTPFFGNTNGGEEPPPDTQG
jgi:hypothetical protein